MKKLSVERKWVCVVHTVFMNLTLWGWLSNVILAVLNAVCVPSRISRPPKASQKNSLQHKAASRPAFNLNKIEPLKSTFDSLAVPAVRGVKVMVWNLPTSANFAEVSSMTTSCGSVRTLNVRKENSTAIIEFSNPQSADHFIRLHNNTVMDGCVLSVNRM